MRLLRVCLAVSLWLVLPISILAQTTTQSSTQAMVLAQHSIQVMCGSTTSLNLFDSVASGTLTVYTATGPVVMPTTYKTKGTKQIRVELQQSSGTNIRIVNNGEGVVVRPDGSVIHLLMNNTLAERVTHIPVLSLLSENQEAAVTVQNAGSSAVNGSITNDVALSYVPNPASSNATDFAAMTRHVFHIDQKSGLVLKIDYKNCGENDPSACENVETVYSDYRSVQGVLVPFLQTTSTDGKPYSQVLLKSVSFNVGLSDSLFALVQ